MGDLLQGITTGLVGRFSFLGDGGTQQSFMQGDSALTLLYNIFDGKGTPFVYLLLTKHINGIPFTNLFLNFVSLLTAVSALSLKYSVYE